ncbi:T9SS type A sorting domain-containing protein [Schleiferiaceae bacterium]|nr:T9SS type A sorting domain-containing protein [Schleiferiaceae bacterium]
MKSVLINALFLIPTIIFGQIENHFQNQDSKWSVTQTYPNGIPTNPNLNLTETLIYGFQGDSTYNSLTWNKLYFTRDTLFMSNLKYGGLLRSDNNYVMHIDTLNQLDTLYNFDLNLGDSAYFNIFGMFPEWLEVTEIDSVQIGSSFYKTIEFAEPSVSAFDWLDEKWIEGIGSIHGPLFPHYPRKFSEETPDSMFLTCSFTNASQVWNHPAYSSCYTNVYLDIDEKKETIFKVYPNPFSEYVILESQYFPNQTRIELYNSIGQLLNEFEPTSSIYKIDLRSLNNGIYFLKIKIESHYKTIELIKN